MARTIFRRAATVDRAPPAATLHVLGCRGSWPVSGVEHSRYGGDTSCYVVRVADRAPVIVDCGTGLRRFDPHAVGAPEAVDVLLSHLHLDHLIGLGALSPLLRGRLGVRIWSTRPVDEVREALRRLYAPPIWPFDLVAERAVEIRHLAGPSEIAGVAVSPHPLNHPGGSTAYVLSADGGRIVVATDHEQGDAAIDQGLVAAARDADLLVIDAPYDDDAYARRRGWGHSSRSGAMALAREAGVRRTLLSHHDPSASDAELDAVAQRLAADAPGVALARQDAVVAVGRSSVAGAGDP